MGARHGWHTVTEMLWGGRFSGGPHRDLLRLTASLATDMRLLAHDLAATKAHARALEKAGLLSSADVESVDRACDEILAAPPTPAETDEDVHSFVERELTARLGAVGERIHAGRSRNDLVATDLRLWCRAAAERLDRLVRGLVGAIADLGEVHADTLMPGYTHLQRAQPVTLGFHLAAHGFALARDAARFTAAAETANVSPLGAGALAGTTLPLEPDVAATELGFDAAFDNAMDAVSDRDFACDLVYATALCGVHLSRLAEEIVLWTSAEFSFARLSDEWSTGSSMMPQKRNPDVAELIRGRAAGGIGDLVGLLAVLKGLPLAYDRDLQEDKGYVFAAADRLAGCLEGMTSLLGALEFDRGALARSAGTGPTWATDAAEALVARGVPFREAHHAVGSLVGALEADGFDLASAPAELLAAAHPALRPEDVELADPRRSVARRSGPGGTAPARVREQAERLRARARGA